MHLPMFADETGKRSFTLTASVLSLATILTKFLFAGVVVGKVNFGPPPDAGIVAALLTPTLGAYVVRRGQDNKSNQP